MDAEPTLFRGHAEPTLDQPGSASRGFGVKSLGVYQLTLNRTLNRRWTTFTLNHPPLLEGVQRGGTAWREEGRLLESRRKESTRWMV